MASAPPPPPADVAAAFASAFSAAFASAFSGATPMPPIPRVYACCRACIASSACCVMLCGVLFLCRFAPAVGSYEP